MRTPKATAACRGPKVRSISPSPGPNGLIDKLIAMGLLSQQDAMGARMMLGMFTVAGSEPDTMTSTIEVDADGHLLANGQRIR